MLWSSKAEALLNWRTSVARVILSAWDDPKFMEHIGTQRRISLPKYMENEIASLWLRLRDKELWADSVLTPTRDAAYLPFTISIGSERYRGLVTESCCCSLIFGELYQVDSRDKCFEYHWNKRRSISMATAKYFFASIHQPIRGKEPSVILENFKRYKFYD